MFDILSVTEENFSEHALALFRKQVRDVPVYKTFVQTLQVNTADVRSVEQIPFLPIQFFKHFEIIEEGKAAQEIFTSSGTGGKSSKHFVADLSLYKRAFSAAFELFYKHPSEYCIVALLPSYLERSGSSLIYMIKHLMEQCAHPASGFFLNQYDELIHIIRQNEAANQKTLLIGVSYALLDMAEVWPDDMRLRNTVIMETGGMKGRRKEMLREELHHILMKKLGVASIHSEYGMTELLSQAYSKGDGLFQTPPWMRIGIRDVNDPRDIQFRNKSGAINVIDLANQHSCAFIATDDLGIVADDGSFKVIGRADYAEVRGCNLMVY